MTIAAVSFAKPPADRARVIIFSGDAWRYTGSSSYIGPHYRAADIYVNDTKIGTLNGLEAMVFDVAPGQYSFRWVEYKQGAEALKTATPSLHNLNGGGLLILNTYYDSGLMVSNRYEMRPGPGNYGAMTSERGGGGRPLRIAPDYMVVRPVSCPPSICL